ncbi:hypothetical protein [Salipaludibacillus sp. CF4.18]|uniref:hypothetical protein n=1 Tax=Salipaludibacillus sp. CF4.18 TaxID=3373081 RepID=UPI003EE44B16
MIPIAFYHGFFHHQLPEWYVHIGQPLSIPKEVPRKDKTHYLEKETEILLDTLKTRVMADEPQLFNVLLEGKKGIGETWEAFKKHIRREKL